jgi:23S rRNA (cytidine1920-2'-O)/16S rRNA (cytidine1409-2'-O)-methyltransferase
MKKRLDILVVEKGLAPSREKAKALIMAGQIFVDGNREDKSGMTFEETKNIEVRGETLRYVSRGGLKLEKAMQTFPITLTDKVCMDVGASTGGFTDCMLQNGAEKVFAVDVGHGQLDWKLRNDPRVTVMERCNARYLQADQFPEKPEITVMDVSFISIRLILPVAAQIMGENGIFYTLIKPQFEAGREKIGKNGVVRDSKTHEEVLNGIIHFAEDKGLHVYRLDFSPITGPEGNIEFLAEISAFRPDTQMISTEEVQRIVADAHSLLLSGRDHNIRPE